MPCPASHLGPLKGAITLCVKRHRATVITSGDTHIQPVCFRILYHIYIYIYVSVDIEIVYDVNILCCIFYTNYILYIYMYIQLYSHLGAPFTVHHHLGYHTTARTAHSSAFKPYRCGSANISRNAVHLPWQSSYLFDPSHLSAVFKSIWVITYVSHHHCSLRYESLSQNDNDTSQKRGWRWVIFWCFKKWNSIRKDEISTKYSMNTYREKDRKVLIGIKCRTRTYQ